MLRKKRCVAMLLAGGQGSRLGILTKHVAKPAVPFGGKYRIIDFPLSNCSNSGVDVVGVLTQYRPLELNAYIASGAPWDLDLVNGGVFVLPPYVTEGENGHWYSGTANAIWQNREFVDQYDPDYVLILSGDHIYKMDYAKMLKFHRQKKAAATIAVLQVPWEEAHALSLGEAARQHPEVRDIAVIIGPEGGMSAGEVQALVDSGALTVTLGPRILRTETAAVISAALAMQLWGDM
jgi:glucose-1-phosphate adenylyltransferase